MLLLALFFPRFVRLVQVAKILGITGQELRKDLMSVELGVKPTDREVSDNLAMGVIRFVANRRKITIDWDAIEAMRGGAGLGVESGEEEKKPVDASAPDIVTEPAQEEKKAPQRPENLNVLRKLTLEGVSKEAIDRQKVALEKQKPKILSKQELEQRRAEGKSTQSLERKDRSEHQQQIKKKVGIVLIPSQISVKEFAEKTGVQVPPVVSTLMKNGVLASIRRLLSHLNLVSRYSAMLVLFLWKRFSAMTSRNSSKMILPCSFLVLRLLL